MIEYLDKGLGVRPEPNKVYEVDMVNQPPHYTESGVEPMDVIEAWKLPHHLACVVKYICRYQHKGGRTDLLKAEWYLKRYLSMEESDG